MNVCKSHLHFAVSNLITEYVEDSKTPAVFVRKIDEPHDCDAIVTCRHRKGKTCQMRAVYEVK